MSSYVSLFNETTGDFDQLTVSELDVDTITINNATVNNATITNATIATENVNNSTIHNLTVGNAIYFPDGTAPLPSISFQNDHSMGGFRYGVD